MLGCMYLVLGDKDLVKGLEKIVSCPIASGNNDILFFFFLVLLIKENEDLAARSCPLAQATGHIYKITDLSSGCTSTSMDRSDQLTQSFTLCLGTIWSLPFYSSNHYLLNR